MTGDYSRQMWAASGIGAIVLLLSLPAQATVYGWKSKGVLYLSNDLGDVPEVQRTTALMFISTPANGGAAKEDGTPTPPIREREQGSDYEHGLERGLQTAERQVALAGELARTVLAAAPPAPPIRIVIEQPPQVIVRYVSPAYDVPFYGFIGPYVPDFPYYGAGYAYGFRRGRFIRHSHFYPGTRSRRRGVFFPHGHFSRDGFLFGHGFVVR